MLRRLLILGLCLTTAAGSYAVVAVRTQVFAEPTQAQPAPMSLSLPRPTSLARIRIVDPTPARLLIPRINVDAAVEARGLDANRNMDIPKNFRDVAWYKLGPAPGQPGNALINGHVNWWTGAAVFTHLNQVRAGDEITVMRADGGSVHFKVTGKTVVDANARIASLFEPSSVATLTLITCAGVWNPLTQSNTQRLLVSAVLA
ncbi:MAG TPA: class F sortase [Candidatus Eisenbacteria bacterium]|nr:class F sortase [Candidatus Eisenbacteria bacterium]